MLHSIVSSASATSSWPSMPKFPRPSGPEFVRFLEGIGFQQTRQRGSHVRLVHPDGRRTTVPIHGNKELPIGLVRAIVRDDLLLSRGAFVEAWERKDERK
jgi:predicted RNA binding protein YcfA (HicA-like mRNA interferase family)